jgi:hypothetical protein
MDLVQNTTQSTAAHRPWNKSKLVGPKPPLQPKHVWAIRTRPGCRGARERLTYRYTHAELVIKRRCTSANQRRITRWEHEHVLEAVQRRLNENPEKMRMRRETAEQPFGTLKFWMGAIHFLPKTLKKGFDRNGAAMCVRQLRILP